jgi:serine/threonine protein kinase
MVKDQALAATKLLAKAPGILKEVDDAVIFKNHAAREIPSFEPNELKFGPILGVGGFCVVREVFEVRLKGHGKGEKKRESVDDAKVKAAVRRLGTSDEVENDEFYHISEARELMAKNYKRDGDARYAVKYLHNDLKPLEEARGRIDLAIEAKYLSVISHPNIIKMRAWAACDPLCKDDSYFIVLDRLYDTLDVRIDKWKQTKKKAKGPLGIMGLGSNKEALKDLMMDRLLVAYDLSAAFRYLHENRLVYRDIKGDNIGFDVRGDVKVFDFGLTKNLSPKLRTKGGMYKLTGRTGSFPYMAPEVAQCLPYNCSADVFSFGIMLWEMLALRPAFGGGLSRKQYYDRVSLGGERPLVSIKWPPLTRQIMQECWATDPKDRPTFKRVAGLIRADLEDMTHDDRVVNRTSHMQQRSIRSRHGLRDSQAQSGPINAQHDVCMEASMSTQESYT